MQIKSGFVHPFFERFVHLFLTFVTMHKTYSEFLCKKSFSLSLLYSTLFWKTAEIIFQLCSFAQKIHRFLPMMSFMLSTTLFHTFSGKYNHFFKKASERVNLSKTSLLYSHGRTQNGTHRDKILSLYAEKSGFCRGGFEEISKKASLIYGNGRVQN